MAFIPGHYDFLVLPACREKFESIIPELRRQGGSRDQFMRALRKLRAEIQLGRQAEDLTRIENTDDYGVTLFGFRVHLEVDQLVMSITIVDIETLN